MGLGTGPGIGPGVGLGTGPGIGPGVGLGTGPGIRLVNIRVNDTEPPGWSTREEGDTPAKRAMPGPPPR